MRGEDGKAGKMRRILLPPFSLSPFEVTRQLRVYFPD